MNLIQNIFEKYKVKIPHRDAFEDLCYKDGEAYKWVNFWNKKRSKY